jgi:hypothetical protein
MTGMSRTQREMLRNLHDDARECDCILRTRATYGARAKPTVAELNNILDRLQNIDIWATLIAQIDIAETGE